MRPYPSVLAPVAFAGLVIAIPGVADETLAPVDQGDFARLVEEGSVAEAFTRAFEAGDELTEHSFTLVQGVGANIGEGRMFTRFPRADLAGEGEWASHFPKREGGANAMSCIACHNAPIANGAGDVALNAIVDPAHTGDPAQYLERNTLPLFALAVPQRLAEEISLELYLQREAAVAVACDVGQAGTMLEAKGVSFGTLAVRRIETTPCSYEVDTAGIIGIDEDLTIRPFGWKGNHATIRAFTRGAAHNELGLQAVELVGEADGDFDGVTGELSVGDLTALTIYMAGLERPVEMRELAALGLVELSEDSVRQISWGESLFLDVGCASCHVPEMVVDAPVFSEPSTTPGFFDETFPDGSDPAAHGLSALTAISFDLTRDQPNNRIEIDGGVHHLGALPVNDDGQAVARWFTDFRRHDMGAELADPSDPLGMGASVFLTRSLAGVGSTGPWLHDGRATTLDEAIRLHAGAALEARNAYLAETAEAQEAITAFLESLVIYDAPH